MIKMIKASQLASCVGKNQYCSVKEALIRLWHDNHPLEHVPVKFCTPDMIVESCISENLRSNLLREDADAEKIVEAVFKTSTEEPSTLISRQQLIDAVDRVISTTKGIRGEQSTLDMYACRRSVRVKEGNDRVRKFPIQPRWWLVGVTDAYHENALLPSIIEVKTRRNHLFQEIPEYEKVQLHAYMYIYRCTSITWVQRFGDIVTWKDVSWDKHLWNEILTGVRDFCVKYNEIDAMNIKDRTEWMED